MVEVKADMLRLEVVVRWRCVVDGRLCGRREAICDRSSSVDEVDGIDRQAVGESERPGKVSTSTLILDGMMFRSGKDANEIITRRRRIRYTFEKTQSNGF